MDTNGKQSIITNCIRLGMGFYESCLTAGCTTEEIEQLQGDDKFQLTVQTHQALLEKELLRDHDAIIEQCVERGNASPLQWKLERINPGRWGGSTKLNIEKPLDGNITINKHRHVKEEGADAS